jgi:uncharacterized protein (DUF427 family)
MDALERSDTTTRCPFKGQASYFTMREGHVKDAAWSYEHPYEEHGELAGRIAFDPERVSDLRFETAG